MGGLWVHALDRGRRDSSGHAWWTVAKTLRPNRISRRRARSFTFFPLSLATRGFIADDPR